MASDPGLRFSPTRVTAGFGAAWCADSRLPVLVRVDEDTLGAEVVATFPASPGGDDSAAPGRGPRAIACGVGAVWVVPREGNRLVRVDPATGRSEVIELPFRLAGVAAGDRAVYGVGEPGDGRLLCYRPPTGLVVRELARTLSSVAASGEYVWTVDAAAGDVLALDAASLQPVRRFRHAGGGDALAARGRLAWQCSARQTELRGRHGRTERAAVFGPAGVIVDVVRFDAGTGGSSVLGEAASAGVKAVLAPDRLWVSSSPVEGPHVEQPRSSLLGFSLDGGDATRLDLPGQVGDLAAGDARLWVSGFRRLRQAVVLTAFTHGGSLVGEVAFRHLDLVPWAPASPEPRPRLPLGEFAERARSLVEQALTEPWQRVGEAGERWREPPIGDDFALERVEVRGSSRRPELRVRFRWRGREELFGLSYPLDDEDQLLAPDGFVPVRVQEDLTGGIEKAAKMDLDGVTWLRPPQGAAGGDA